MDEKRKNERFKITFKSEVESEESLTLSHSQDLSNGGIFISTAEPLTPGTKVKLSLSFSEKKPVELTGKVKWNRNEESDQGKIGMGIEFEDLDDKKVEEIKEIIDRR